MAGQSSLEPRPYTAGERELLTVIFGSRVHYDRVRICRGAQGNALAAIAFSRNTPAITLGRTIHFREDYYRDDFSPEGESLAGLMAHESTHIWQYQTQLGEVLGPPRVALDSLRRGGDPYDLSRVTAATQLSRLGYEQQAQVTQVWVESSRWGPVETNALLASVLRSAGLLSAAAEIAG